MVYDSALPDETLERVMCTAARNGGMLQLHCEEPGIIDPLCRGGARPWGCRLPPSRAHEARARGGRRHATRDRDGTARRRSALHRPSQLRQASDAVAEAKDRGEPVHAETCPHYLTFTDELYADDDEAEVIKRVISPPLRTRADVDALWAGLRDGVLDIVASDHVPDRLDTEKRVPAPPFPQISNGAPGIETLLSVVYSEGVAKGRIGVERMVDVLSATPSRLFGLPSKGAIEAGRDADLVLLDPRVTANDAPGRPASHERLHTV